MEITYKKITVGIYFLCFFLIFGTVWAASRSQNLTESDIEYLVRIFQDAEFDEKYLHRVFSDSRLRFYPGLVQFNVASKDFSANYKRFLQPVALGMAEKFARKWRTALKNAGREFDVDKEVVTAILLVETSLGEHLGNVPVMSVFASIILGNYGRRRKDVERALAEKFGKDKYLERLETKFDWSKQELYALLKMRKDYGMNIYDLKGSYSGAFGIPQFLPSSYLEWGCDGDKSDSVNLFEVPDTITSVVNYLKAHGWKRGLSHESNKKVLWNYNRSQVYVNTVLQIAQKLQKTTRSTN